MALLVDNENNTYYSSKDGLMTINIPPIFYNTGYNLIVPLEDTETEDLIGIHGDSSSTLLMYSTHTVYRKQSSFIISTQVLDYVFKDFKSFGEVGIKYTVDGVWIIDRFELLLFRDGKLHEKFKLPYYSHVINLIVTDNYDHVSGIWLWYINQDDVYLSYNVMQKTNSDMQYRVIRKNNYVYIDNRYIIDDNGRFVSLTNTTKNIVEVIGNIILVDEEGNYYDWLGNLIDQTKYIPYIENSRQVKSARNV